MSRTLPRDTLPGDMLPSDTLPRDTLPAGAVIGIVAGGGAVPALLHGHLTQQGRDVRLIALAGEATLADEATRAGGATLAGADATHSIGDVEGVLRSFERLGVTHAVLIGWVRRRPRLAEARLGRRALRGVPGLLRALARGDDAMLRAAVAAIEGAGVQVVGVQDLWPELVCEQGPVGRERPSGAERALIERCAAAARALGRYDVGQGVVAVGRRIVAVEGLEGTDEMVERVARLRATGRLRQSGGVLVKMAKPGQELRADLPSIGPDTVGGAASAGLRGIAVEAGRSLLIERERTLALADEHKLFVCGIGGEGAA